MRKLDLEQSCQRLNNKVKARLSDPRSWALPKQPSSIAPPNVWSNADQDPVPLEKQTWTGVTFVTYWMSDLISVSGWSAAGSLITTGLSAADAITAVMVAGICNAIPTVLNGVIGAELHIPFPVAIRASYGSYLAYFCIISRAILALFWFGVQSAYGGSCVTPMITAIWPSFAHLPNHLPASAGLTTQGMISYFLYHVVQFPILFIPTHKLQYMLWAKAILVLPMALAMVIYLSVKAGGAQEIFNQPASVHGAARSWLWLSSMTAITGGYTTLTVNIPDFSRFSKSQGSNLYQLPIIPLLKVITGLFGVIGASAAKKIYGKALWSPIDILNEWQGTSGGRAAAFFCASLWLLAQICNNMSANAVSFSNDLVTLAPKWFNMRRGSLVVFLLGGWALCPWIIIESAQSFLNFMSGYAIFMAPIAGILFCDYWLVKKRKYDVPALYDPQSIYFYDYGCNWRALICTLIVIVPLLPALGNAVNPSNVHISTGLKHLYNFNWLFGFLVSIFLYYFLNLLFPHNETLIPAVVPAYPEDGMIQGVSLDPERISHVLMAGTENKKSRFEVTTGIEDKEF